jgi:hypothetical protein
MVGPLDMGMSGPTLWRATISTFPSSWSLLIPIRFEGPAAPFPFSHPILSFSIISHPPFFLIRNLRYIFNLPHVIVHWILYFDLRADLSFVS